MMCLGVGFLHPSCLGLCASWTCMSMSPTKLGKFSFIIFSNRFPISCSFSSSGTPMMRMLYPLKLSQRLLILSSFFLNSFSFLLFWLVVFWYVPNHWLNSCLQPLYCYFPKLFRISLSESFISDWIFFKLLRSSLSSLSILITSVLNSASGRLFISISFSSFSEVLISFGPCFFVSSFWQPPCVCFYVLGRAALTLFLGSVA